MRYARDAARLLHEKTHSFVTWMGPIPLQGLIAVRTACVFAIIFPALFL